MNLASFDIFDTVLIRSCGVSENVFFIAAQRLFPNDPGRQHDFVCWRRQAENRWRRSHEGEPCLADIYTGFHGECMGNAFETEMRVEADVLTANPSLVNKINEYRTHGFSIAFISDMYLSEDFLRKILIREQCFRTGDQIYVSCECQCRKDSGKLFLHVKEMLHPKQWVHFGDNYWSDVKIPRRHGIKGKLVDSGFSATENKMIMAAKSQHNPFYLKYLAGICRSARLVFQNTPEVANAADFIAPMYIPYVKYVMNFAKTRAFDNVFFVSRDSWIFYQIAKAFGYKSGAQMRMRELFISRRALCLPYLACQCTADAFLAIMDQNTLVRKNVDELLALLGIERKDLCAYGIEFRYAKVRTLQEEQDFLQKIFMSDFTDSLSENATKQLSCFLQYLQHEGISSGRKNLLVDIGWLGTTRLMLNKILDKAHMGSCEFIYYSVRKDVIPYHCGAYVTYFSSGQFPSGHTALLEHYFSASPNRSTVRYSQQEFGRPLFGNSEIEEETVRIANVNATVLTYIAANIADISNEIPSLWESVALESLDAIALKPLLFMGNFDSRPLVRRYSPFNLLAKVATGRGYCAWEPGGVRMTLGHKLSKVFWFLFEKTERIRMLFHNRTRSL